MGNERVVRHPGHRAHHDKLGTEGQPFEDADVLGTQAEDHEIGSVQDSLIVGADGHRREAGGQVGGHSRVARRQQDAGGLLDAFAQATHEADAIAPTPSIP